MPNLRRLKTTTHRSYQGRYRPIGTYTLPPCEVSGGLIVTGGMATVFLFPCLLVSISIKEFIYDSSYLWEVMSSSIYDILYSTVNSDEIVLTDATLRESGSPVPLTKPYTQVYMV